jgi:hypothetical protein
MVGKPEVIVGAKQQHGLSVEHDGGPLRARDQAQPMAQAKALKLYHAICNVVHRAS